MSNDRPIAVVGGGTMGCGVAHGLAAAGHRVLVLEPDERARRSGASRVRDAARLAVLLGHDRASPEDVLANVEWVGWDDIADVRFVVECAPERIALKESLFRDLDQRCPQDAVLASCTSAIPIGVLADRTGRPDRVIGVHFMNPVPVKRFVEVARTPRTSAETLAATTELLAGMGKEAIVVSDAPGFVTNRVLMATINDAATVVQEGTADAATVDEIFQRCFDHRMGPLRTADLIGLDTVVDTLHVLRELTGNDRYVPCDLLVGLVRDNRLGRKTGRGFHGS
ncbi:3-hydroxyacyl-CoA dehydrogenase family protein [Saccharothrix longispora]|uniref:3-hydroxyacyl-CoA dehydrogenase family protein n=1 Tax=Saccharothrix longispora TaxID=33920 RepID=UPI0028FD2B58|nr:3-hydroxyacyl-CoA dehydrogenase family protein [Saccharothrix longispora]MDU0289576.1 3-hydroxyacyl-CoA dehydrogenase family protein [Saccharothrix longispora]